MNNKGITLVELMVSMVLISIVMVFIFALLLNMKNEDYLSSAKSEDSLNRSEIIHLIENDFINYNLSSVAQTSCPSGANFCLRFGFYNYSYKNLYFFEDHLVYDNEVFYLSTGSFEIDKIKYCYTKKESLNSSLKDAYSYFSLSVPVTHDAAVKRKNSIDLSYLSTKKNYIFSVPNSFSFTYKGNYIQVLSSC